MSIARAKAAYALLINTVRTVVLGTVSAENMPNVSYAPFIIDEAKNIYIFVSELSIHTYNLQINPKASVMLIEDETKSKQIFTRRRLTYFCNATKVDKNSKEWEHIANQFEKRFGNIVYMLRNLPDINIIKFTPSEGIFIMDFGSAYKIKSGDLSHLIYIAEDANNNK
ncbi:MAG: pyridoxamine 5'-phosphate oxidase family protein [Cyanobacteriota bacterium]|nr:pyridoxamine 5'-phosphate oxidase family protein [Cyanobacteriota bacterium]